MGSDGIRAKRLGGTIRKHLSAALAREIHDPRLAALAIENVELTGDLGLATVLVRLVVGGEDAKARADAVRALQALAPGLRSMLAPVLRMRRVPDLRFRYDEGFDHRRRIEEVLAEIHDEDRVREAERARHEGGAVNESNDASASRAPEGTAPENDEH